ncbi:MAG: HEAT repeat domain-containing protein [Pontiellaceae bacterium]|nr:HEAT repeat domain-containing protein [Pontiellaceae bacterium]
MNELFNRACLADGVEYGRACDEILTGKNMLGHLWDKYVTMEYVYDKYEMLIIRLITKRALMRDSYIEHYELYECICGIIDRIKSEQHEMLEYLQSEVLLEGNAAELRGSTSESKPFDDYDTTILIELALKGISLPVNDDEEKQEWYSHWARCYAAGVLGGKKGQDIVFVLIELLENSASYELRTMGAIGLRRTKSPDAVEPLIVALSDKEEPVRKAASQGLKEITGVDFGEDAQQYRTWWSANKDRLTEDAPE